MHGITFLQDLALVMIVAGLVTVLFHRFKQPVVLGYILAGAIIGPHTPPFPLIHDEETIRTLSELGVIFLMFSLGLEFNLRKLKAVGATAFIGATLEILLMVWIGYQIGRIFGWSQMDSIFLGAILSISSTTIIVKALEELGKTKERFANLIFGILIVEDILAIVMIALLSGYAKTGSLNVGEIARTTGEVSLFLVVVLVAGLLVVPRLLSWVARFRSHEVLLITVLALCFGVSLLAAKLGYSIALGAFLIGAVIAEAREIKTIEHLVEPVRDMFSAVFFVSIGLLIDPKLLAEFAVPILVITAAVVVGKVIACSFGAFIAGNDVQTSLRVGMGLAQIGEFSFIIASLGLTLNVTSGFLYPIAVAVSALTTLLTPYLIRGSDGAANLLTTKAGRPVRNYLDVYTRWLNELGKNRPKHFAATLLRSWILVMALNLALIAAIFIVAAFFESHALEWWPDFPGGTRGVKAALWLAAMTASLPLFIATMRKFRAFSMLLSELSVPASKAGERTAGLRALISGTILMAGYAGVGLFTLLLSSAILPPWNVMAVLAGVLAVAAFLLRQQFIRVYAKAQLGLRETFAQPPARPVESPEPAAGPLPGFLRHAQLRMMLVPAASPWIGRTLRELQIRTHTGASVVGIERAGENIVNPDADQEIAPGDRLLLLGSGGQLATAEGLLNRADGGEKSP